MILNMIENSISWDRLGKRSRSEYAFSVRKAAISKETGELTIDMAVNFVMPYDDMLKIRALILNQLSDLGGVRFNFFHEDMVQTEEEIAILYLEHMIEKANGSYRAVTNTIVLNDTEYEDGELRVYAVGEFAVNTMNEKLSAMFEEMLKSTFGIRCSVLFINDEEKYASAIANIQEKATEVPDVEKRPMAASSAPKNEGKWGRNRNVRDEVQGNKIMGRFFEGEATSLGAVSVEDGPCIVEGIVYRLDSQTIRKDELLIAKILITDKKTTMLAKAFVKPEKWDDIESNVKPGTFVRIRGIAEDDQFEHMVTVKMKDLMIGETSERKDTCEIGKRVELHLHTRMSAMDGLNDAGGIVKLAKKWGHPAIAITDHGVVQSFPDAAKAGGGDIKVIFGLEGYLLDDEGLIDEEGNIDYKARPTNHIILLAKTQEGLKNIYKLVSLSHLNYFHNRPRIPRSVLDAHREGLIVGAACEAGEVYQSCVKFVNETKRHGRVVREAKSREEQLRIASYYDYLEVQPVINNRFMLEREYYFNDKRIESYDDLRDVNRHIAELASELGKPLVATTDSHYTNEEDAIYRNILLASHGFADAESGEGLFFRTTDEMLEEFSYLGEELARKVVIDNPVAIADMVEEGIRPVPKGKFPPHIDGAEETLRTTCYENAHAIYGDPLPEPIQARLDKELNSIIGNGYAVMYVSAQMLVNKSLSDGYLVGSRGSVGSSFAATMAGITEVNPLPPHYVCPECKHLEWGDENLYDCGVDMPVKECPECGTKMNQLGFTIPFETFLGFEGDKEPDIDLNFAGEYQPRAHRYVGEIFGEKNVFKAGTVGTVADKTAYGYVMKFAEEYGRSINKYEAERLAEGCTGVKRTTGQHPGGIIICPDDHEIYEFCPIQHPADKTDTDIVTTHFDYHKIDENLLKLDILGHDVPSMIRHLQDMTGVDPFDVPLKDEKVNSLFLNADALDIKNPDYRFVHGSFGIPEFGTKFTRQMLDDTQPSRFGDLVRISGFSHGTDVWINNAQEFILNGDTTIKEAISTRDDIMNYLILKGLPNKLAFTIMERVRKGKVAGGKVPEWPEWTKIMKENNVPDWYIESCARIKYMFPRAHAVAYVMMSYRIAWFKVYYPVQFYSAYFSTKVADFNTSVILGGIEKILSRMDEIAQKGGGATTKEKDENIVLEVAYEMYSRGYEFMPMKLGISHGSKFYEHDGKVLLPFMAVDGVGENAAMSIYDEYKKKPFDTIEEMISRTKISKTNVESLRALGVLEGMPETDQLSMF